MFDMPELLSPLAPGLPLDVGRFLPDPDALAGAWAALEPGDGAALTVPGCPPHELLATPAAARAGLLAARIGRGFSHHELRVRLPMPDGLEPEQAVWEGGTVPSWQRGVLAEPKYFSFFLDGPHSPFNPNHRGKWRSHELLHGVVGFCWHPGLTRFELYLGARIAELLPVVHWYGLDEMFRPRCPLHVDAGPPRHTCPACEDAARTPFWAQDRQAGLPAARAWAEQSRDHLQLEWQAILDELDGGERVSTRPRLRCGDATVDGSSDAEGYLLGHWNRLTAWSFGAWVERFLQPGIDHEPGPQALALRMARTLHAMTSGRINVDPVRQQRLADRRLLQDLGYRLLLLIEPSDSGGPVESGLLPQVDALAQACAGLLDDNDAASVRDIQPLVEAALKTVDRLADHLPPGQAAAVGALGYRWRLRAACLDAGLEQVVAGLDDALPASFAELPDREEVAWRFVDSTHFDGVGSLAARFAAWWQAEDGPDLDAMRLEAALRDLPARDHDAELFTVLPDDDQLAQGLVVPPRLRLNGSLRRLWVDPEVLGPGEEGTDRLDELGRVELALAWLGPEAGILELDQALADAIDAIDAGRAPDADAAHRLLEAGVAAWWPAPGIPGNRRTGGVSS